MLKSTIYSKLYTEKAWFKNNKTVLKMKIQHRLFLFLFNRKSLCVLETSLVPPVATYVELRRK